MIPRSVWRLVRILFYMQKLTLIRGIPGSGKSTQARSLGLLHHYEADMWFAQNGGYDRAKIKQAHEWCQQRAYDALASGESVVIANTFCRRWEMQPYLDAAKKHGATVEIIVANGRWQNVHGVPPEVVRQMEARFES